MRRKEVLLCAAMLITAFLCACICTSNNVLLNEPKSMGLDSNGKPCFLLSWSQVRNAEGYEIAIRADLDGYSGWVTKRTDGKKATETEIVLLQGIYTDTVTYQIKVRPIFDQNTYGMWSNVWMIDFDCGEFIIENNADDFVETNENPLPTEIPENSMDNDMPSQTEHFYPESLTSWYQEETGSELPDLKRATSLSVIVNRGLYTEPGQHITDSKIIRNVINAIDNISVMGPFTDIESSEASYRYIVYDTEDTILIDFLIQAEMLNGNNVFYEIVGLEKLLSIESIYLESDWDEYWQEQHKLDEEYDASFQPAFPENVFRMSGRNASNLFRRASRARIEHATLYMPYNFQLTYDRESDPEKTRMILDALLKIQINGEISENSEGQEWRILLDYCMPGDSFSRTAEICFFGDCFVSDEIHYETGGTENLLKLFDGETSRYLRKHRNHSPINPVY